MRFFMLFYAFFSFAKLKVKVFAFAEACLRFSSLHSFLGAAASVERFPLRASLLGHNTFVWGLEEAEIELHCDSAFLPFSPSSPLTPPPSPPPLSSSIKSLRHSPVEQRVRALGFGCGFCSWSNSITYATEKSWKNLMYFLRLAHLIDTKWY